MASTLCPSINNKKTLLPHQVISPIGFYMSNTAVKSVVIVGGGTAGWMAAALLSKRFDKEKLKVTLIESADIGIIGVGEATVPAIKMFLNDLDISERDFVQHTQATFKLGIDFDGWHKAGESFFHPFANFGTKIAQIPFQHYWNKLRASNKAEKFDVYCYAAEMARQGKFIIPHNQNTEALSQFNYAYHFDAGLFAKFLSQYAQKQGIIRIEDTITKVNQHLSTGFIEALELQSGATIHGDFFIDCSGLKGLLIEETLHAGYTDWSHWLLCNRAVAMPSTYEGNPPPYTRSLAMEAGWQWRIPLQHRNGNGYVYCSDYISDDEAIAKLRENLEGEALADPKLIKFKTGTRKKYWEKNVFALGLASGFMEPLESTSIYLVQFCIESLYNHFPQQKHSEALSKKVNELILNVQERMRDFLILHYYANKRIGQPFWDYCRTMEIPKSLSDRIEEYKASAGLFQDSRDFFKMNSWLSMFTGFDIIPNYYHPKIDSFDERLLEQELKNMAQSIKMAAARIPQHQLFINKHCAAQNIHKTPLPT